MTKSKTLALSKQSNSSEGKPEEREEHEDDYTSYHAWLFDNLMLSMLVDEHGRLLTTSYAIVSEFSEEVAQEITEELVTELGVGGGKLKLHCYGSDIREDTTKSLADLIEFQAAVADRVAEWSESLTEVSETA